MSALNFESPARNPFGEVSRHHGQGRILGILFLMLLAFPCVASAGEFGEPARFKQGKAIEVSGITIEFLGQRHVSHPVFKPGFTYYDFRVGNGEKSETVSWSSGTGEIGPARFKLAGKPYMLELRASIARKGWLKDDELVLWPEKEFLKASENRTQ